MTNYAQTGKINKKYNYLVNILGLYNTENIVVNQKEYVGGLTHFVPHVLLIQKYRPKTTFGYGYAYGRHDIFGLRENEHRIMAQVVHNQKVDALSYSHRLRYEYRSPLNLRTNIRDNASILRYQIGGTVPLYNVKKGKQGFYGIAANEMFAYLKGAENGPVSSKNNGLLCENWLNLGLGYTTGPHRVEFGFGRQKLYRNPAKDKRIFSLAQLNIYTTLNWQDVQFWWY